MAGIFTSFAGVTFWEIFLDWEVLQCCYIFHVELALAIWMEKQWKCGKDIILDSDLNVNELTFLAVLMR